MRSKKLSAYIHIPFCKSKCYYCDFNSYAGCESQIDRYLQALCSEILFISKYYKNHGPGIMNRKLSSVFIGGGTPSYIPSSYITKILDLLESNIGLSDSCEITIECNPGTLDLHKAIEYKAAGINRVSVGLQCYSDQVLKVIGRIHSCAEFITTTNILKKVGLKNINVDMMIGLPQQGQENVIETIRQSILAGAEHISVYSLTLEPDTKMAQIYSMEPGLFPSEDSERTMYQNAKEFLHKNGFEHYEISNFAKPGKECLHNVLCWTLNEYVGFGAGAHSYINGLRYSNPKPLEGYMDWTEKIALKETNEIWDEMNKILDSESENEFFLLGLRLIKGVCEQDFERIFQKKMDSYYPVLNRLIQNGLLTKNGSYYKLSSKGIHVANQVFIEFV